MIKIKNTSDKIWLFDYDLTLYGQYEKHVLYSMDKNITQFVMNSMDVEWEEANRLRKSWWKEYGTTLAGLRVHCDINPDEFFDFIHSGERIKRPKFNQKKVDFLKRIKGQRHIFTNGRRDWVDAGLKSMKLEDMFCKILDIKTLKWQGKPFQYAYDFADKFFNLNGSEVVFLDDSIDNLKIAKEKKWTTILIGSEFCDEVDFSVDDLLDLEKILED